LEKQPLIIKNGLIPENISGNGKGAHPYYVIMKPSIFSTWYQLSRCPEKKRRNQLGALH
jgi:hypothetical protein